MADKKKLKKYGDIRIPAQSLHPPDKDGFLTKQGGSIKTWKRRYFILKGKTLYYYKSPKDQTITGRIDLEPSSLVKEEPEKKKAATNMFSVTTAKRIFFMFPDKPEETEGWVAAIQKGIEIAKSGGGASPLPMSSEYYNSPETSENNADNETNNPRARLKRAKNEIPFLKPEDSKVLEFWQIWSESIPEKSELSGGMSIDFHVSISADMQKLTWRVGGPQNVFIQKMVDFFWNVGAPESEIDRLNDVGALINPVKIGSWIDMSAKGGMDGGWYFPVGDIPVKLAIEAADAGEAITKFQQWAESNNITTINIVGRDMGAAPPRQTEMRFQLPQGSSDALLQTALDAWEKFEIPPMPEEAKTILMESKPSSIFLSVITSQDGFVRFGILTPDPSTETVLALSNLINKDSNKNDELAQFEASLGGPNAPGPAFAEYQYLMKGYGYGVYKEGFDIIFHYKVGEEVA